MSIEHEKLRAEALPLNLFVGVHKTWKVGPYFVSVLREPTKQLAKFITAAEVRALLARYRAGNKSPLPPPPKTDVSELVVLQAKARLLGLYVGEHRTYDPCLPGGPYFVVPKRKRGEDGTMPTLLKYATREDVENLLERESENYAA